MGFLEEGLNYEKYEITDRNYLKKENFYGISPLERSIEEKLEKGVLVVDKPTGVTSQDMVVHLKRVLQSSKASHIGTLDPAVTGVLPILLNRSVKINHYLSKKDKEYVALMVLHKKVDEERIKEVIKSFEGRISQLPPRKSAVKRRIRKRRIYNIEILEIDSNRYVLFRTKVEAGTYIRALCRDIGKKLGVGAHMQELRRVFSAGYKEEECLSFYDVYERAYLYSRLGKKELLEEILLPIEDIIHRNFKTVYVKDEAASSIVYGAKLFSRGIVMYERGIKKGEIIGVFTLKNIFIGLMECAVNFENPAAINSKKEVAVPVSIFVRREEMPQLWKRK